VRELEKSAAAPRGETLKIQVRADFFRLSADFVHQGPVLCEWSADARGANQNKSS
jgi:hypothetical protein